jgi:hypothetical protein
MEYTGYPQLTVVFSDRPTLDIIWLSYEISPCLYPLSHLHVYTSTPLLMVKIVGQLQKFP